MSEVQQSQPDTGLYKYIYNAARIAGIAAIVSLAGTLAGVLGVFTKPTTVAPTAVPEGFNEQQVQQLAQGSVYISVALSVLLSVLVFYFLYRFSSLAQAGVKEDQQEKIQLALRHLSRYFKVWGIIMLLIVGLFVLSLLGGMLGSLFAG